MTDFSDLPAGDREAIGKTLLAVEGLRRPRRAVQRQRDGSWLIDSEMFQDANTETSYLH
jgi:hypothetical protein